MNVWSWQQAIQKSRLSSTTKLVLFNLSCYINAVGEGCYPSTKRQAAETGLSERSICTHLAIAKEQGFIEIKKHGFAGQEWARNEYYVTFPKGTELGSARHEKALNVVPKGTEPDDKKALKEVQSNIPVNIPENYPVWLPYELWCDFLAMRKIIKKPATEKAQTLMIADLQKLRTEGHDPKTVLEQSIKNNWQGLFGIKTGFNSGTKTSTESPRRKFNPNDED